MGDSPVTPNLNDVPVVNNPLPPNVIPPTAPPENTPGLQQNQPVANAPQATPAQPNAQTAQPQAPAPTPAQQHAGIFHQVLSVLGGGGNRPVMGPNGQPQTDANGNVIMAPASAKQLGMGILAGAISGMVAGMATPTKYNDFGGGRKDFGGGRKVPDYSGAFAAGAQAATPFTQQGAQEAAQKQAAGASAQQFATMDHNMRLHQNYLSNLKMQGELLQSGIDDDEPLITGLEAAGPVLGQDGKPLLDKTGQPIQPVIAQGVTEDKLLPMMKDGSVTRQSLLRDGQIQQTDADSKPLTNPDGTPHMVWTYTVYDHRAMVAMTNEMKGLSTKLDDVSEGTAVPISVLAKYSQQKTAARGAQTALGNQIATYNKSNPDAKIDEIDLKSNPAIQQILPQIAKYGTDPLDLMFKDLRADKTVSGSAVAALAQALHVTDEGLNQMGVDRASALAEGKKNDAQKPADPARTQNAPALIKAKNTNLPAASLNDYNSRLHAGMSNDELDKVMKDATAESEKVTAQQLAQDSHDQARAAKDDARIQKGEKPVVGIDASGRQVLVPAGDVTKYGLSQVREVGQAENEKVTNARSLMTVFNDDDPDDLGLVQLANKLNKEGKLGPVASRFQDWLNKLGSVPTSLAGFDAGDPDVQRLFTKLGLSTTGLMQVHVGARGSAAMLEHFADLANAKQMSGDAFAAALDTENKYIKMKAMLPQKQAQQVPQAQKVQNQPNKQNQGGFNPNAFPKVQ